jgi:hypothetical protein
MTSTSDDEHSNLEHPVRQRRQRDLHAGLAAMLISVLEEDHDAFSVHRLQLLHVDGDVLDPRWLQEMNAQVIDLAVAALSLSTDLALELHAELGDTREFLRRRLLDLAAEQDT